MQSTSWETLDWKKQAGIKIAGRNINNLRYADDTTLMAESEEELKSLLMKVKEESEKVDSDTFPQFIHCLVEALAFGVLHSDMEQQTGSK